MIFLKFLINISEINKVSSFLKKNYYTYKKRNTMKNIIPFILFLLFIPMISLSQSESDQKRQRRVERYQRPVTTPDVVVVPNPYISPYYNPYVPYYYNRYTPYTPYYGLPVATPTRLFNRPVFSMGVLSTIGTDPSLPTFGVYGTVGSENVFFKMSYEGSRVSNIEHYNNITLNDVYSWNDQSRGEFERYSALFVGMGGKLTPSIYPFLGANFYFQEQDLIFYDELHILSNDGEYSINGIDKNGLNVRGGIMFRKNNFEAGTNITLLNPARFGANIGLNF
jgi:hypothetical protein